MISLQQEKLPLSATWLDEFLSTLDGILGTSFCSGTCASESLSEKGAFFVMELLDVFGW